jgi:hypothetical protein
MNAKFRDRRSSLAMTSLAFCFCRPRWPSPTPKQSRKKSALTLAPRFGALIEKCALLLSFFYFKAGADKLDRRHNSALAVVHRDLIITLAARHKLSAVYFQRFFVTTGGLISYGPEYLDQFRRAAGYVDRILKGEKPADLPVQAPTKYELVIKQSADFRI